MPGGRLVGNGGGGWLADAQQRARLAAVHGDVGADLVMALRQARLDAGLSQRELAAAMGVRAHSVQDWELAEDGPRAQNLISWASVLRHRLVLVDRHGQRRRRALERWPDESTAQFEARRMGVMLREERLRLRLTEPEMATACGVSIPTIRRGEVRGPGRLRVLIAWPEALEWSVHLVADARRSARG
jgi:transcriptional regulator with XRE-family HTH domain